MSRGTESSAPGPAPDRSSKDEASCPEPKSVRGPVRLIRETDGLEPLLRLAAIWQRVADSPLRRTSRGSFFRKDFERLTSDPCLAESPPDGPAVINDPALFWFELALGTRVLRPDFTESTIVASPVQDWLSGIERLGHALPSTWIGLTNWNEVSGWTAPEEVRASLVEAPRFRRAVISALSRVDRGRWVKVQEVEELCRDLVSGSDASPHGDHAILRAHSRFERDHSRWTTAILGAAWILGLVRMGELSRGGHAIVQATERSRKLYDASEPEVTESPGLPCLWIQPNFEIIAYRQGLVPSLIGTLGVWSRLDRIGTAVQLRLDADSIARGLQGGGDVEGFLESLERGATRGVPPAVAEAVRSWARQRQRVSVYPEATLMEFATDEERATAVAAWPESDRCTVMLVGERYLLVESETGVPFGRFRLLGSRDYRQPAEANAVVGEDGLTLSIDLDRSDLFIEAELARLADREPMISAESARRRKFRVTRESVKRAIESGWGVAEWTEWFERRTGQALPPAARLLVEAGQANVVCFRVSRRFVLTASEANWLDGLAQHAAQSGLELERVGPRSMLVAEDDLSRLRALIQSLGVDVSIE